MITVKSTEVCRILGLNRSYHRAFKDVAGFPEPEYTDNKALYYDIDKIKAFKEEFPEYKRLVLDVLNKQNKINPQRKPFKLYGEDVPMLIQSFIRRKYVNQGVSHGRA